MPLSHPQQNMMARKYTKYPLIYRHNYMLICTSIIAHSVYFTYTYYKSKVGQMRIALCVRHTFIPLTCSPVLSLSGAPFIYMIWYCTILYVYVCMCVCLEIVYVYGIYVTTYFHIYFKASLMAPLVNQHFPLCISFSI